jgi:hypothetical protein
MKNLILAFALVGVIAACKNEQKAVADDSSASMPDAECCAEKTGCEASKAHCAESMKSCGAAKAEPQN